LDPTGATSLLPSVFEQTRRNFPGNLDSLFLAKKQIAGEKKNSRGDNESGHALEMLSCVSSNGQATAFLLIGGCPFSGGESTTIHAGGNWCPNRRVQSTDD